MNILKNALLIFIVSSSFSFCSSLKISGELENCDLKLSQITLKHPVFEIEDPEDKTFTHLTQKFRATDSASILLDEGLKQEVFPFCQKKPSVHSRALPHLKIKLQIQAKTSKDQDFQEKWIQQPGNLKLWNEWRATCFL